MPYDIPSGAEFGTDTGFEVMISYAWYIYIEDRATQYRDEATRALEVLCVAARRYRLEKVPIDHMSLDDFHELKQGLADALIPTESANLALSYLLKFLQILGEKKLIDINLTLIAMHL